MALREEFERTGNRLFRWRSYLPLVMIAAFLSAMALGDAAPPGSAAPLWGVACLAVSALGLAIRIYTVGHAPPGTSGRNTRAQSAVELNTTGAYSAARHPLYLGNFLAGLGAALFSGVWWLLPVYMLAFWLYYERIMFAEEEYLRATFGDAFLGWAARTPAVLPRSWRLAPPSTPFSWRRALRGEYGGAFAIAAIFVAMDAVRASVGAGRLTADPGWLVFALAVGLGWATVRVLAKRTRLLVQQEG